MQRKRGRKYRKGDGMIRQLKIIFFLSIFLVVATFTTVAVIISWDFLGKIMPWVIGGILALLFLGSITFIFTYFANHHADRSMKYSQARKVQPIMGDWGAAYEMLVLPNGKTVQPEAVHAVPGHAMRSMRFTPMPPRIEEKVEEPTPLPLHVPSLGEMLKQGMLSGDKLFLGKHQDGEWLSLPYTRNKLTSILFAGSTGSGKSNSLRGMVGQLALKGAVVVVVDPHSNVDDEDSLGRSLALLPCLLGPPVFERQDVVDAIGKVEHEMKERLAGRKSNAYTLVLVIDEFNSVMRSFPEVQSMIEAIIFEGRKVGVICLLTGQNFSGKAMNGTSLRNGTPTIVAHRQAEGTAKLLPGIGEYARPISRLAVGQAMVVAGGDEPLLITAPRAGDADMEAIADVLHERNLSTIAMMPKGAKPLQNPIASRRKSIATRQKAVASRVATPEKMTIAIGEKRTDATPLKQDATVFAVTLDLAARVKMMKENGISDTEIIRRLWPTKATGGGHKIGKARLHAVKDALREGKYPQKAIDAQIAAIERKANL